MIISNCMRLYRIAPIILDPGAGCSVGPLPSTTIHKRRAAMSPQEHKAIARRFLEESFPQGRFEPILAPGYQDHNAPPGTRPGPAGIVQITEPYRQAFPDLHFTVEDQ